MTLAPAEQLIVGGKVRTAAGVPGDAVMIRDGVVAAVGAAADLRRAGLHEVAYPDAVLLPGMRDAHFHPVAYAAAVTRLTLDGTTSIAEVLDVVRAEAERTGPGVPIEGLRLDDAALAERRLPTARELDTVSGATPVVLHRYCGHVTAVNTAALGLGGVTSSTPDPGGGSIDRDETGTATGILRETAIDIVTEAIAGRLPVAPAEVAVAMRGLARHGITSIGAIVRRGSGSWAGLGDETAIVAAAGDAVPIKLRCYVVADNDEQFREAGRLLGDAGPRIRWQGLKRFGDGSFGGHTAAMDEPFSDLDTTGLLRLDETDAEMVGIAIAAGKDVAIHAIGDRAGAAVLDLFERFGAPRSDVIFRMEHASVLRADDVRRLAALDVVASVQPPFLGSEAGWLAHRVGRERISKTYAFRSMIDAGVTVAGGSDCPVEVPDPWSGMALARDRAGVAPDQSLTAAEALALYTTGAAAALGEPEPLAPGGPADLIAVDRDPVASSPNELRGTEVLATYVDGIAVDLPAASAAWRK